MATLTVEVPESVAINLKYHGEQSVILAGKSVDWLEWAIANGVRQSCADADAGKANTPEGRKAVLDKFTRIAAGEVPAGGGGGGPRMSYEEKAERIVLEDIFRAQGEKAVVAAKSAKDNAAWDRVTRVAIYAQAHQQGMDATAIKALDVKGLIDQHRDTVKAAYADAIKEKAMELKKADQKVQVKIPTGITLG